MAIALVAIVFALMMSEGCGSTFEMVTSLDFSPDGKQLVVVKYNARDADEPYKRCIVNVRRTICTVDVQATPKVKVVEKALLSGEPLHSSIFCPNRKCAAFGQICTRPNWRRPSTAIPKLS